MSNAHFCIICESGDYSSPRLVRIFVCYLGLKENLYDKREKHAFNYFLNGHIVRTFKCSWGTHILELNFLIHMY